MEDIYFFLSVLQSLPVPFIPKEVWILGFWGHVGSFLSIVDPKISLEYENLHFNV